MQDGEHIDRLTGAKDVDLRLLAVLRAAAELQDSLHVDGLHDAFKAECGRVLGTGVSGANGEVEALGGGPAVFGPKSVTGANRADSP